MVSSWLQCSPPHTHTLIAPTDLNEMCCCVDSRRHWPLSWSQHLFEIGWDWYNPGRGIITPPCDRHEVLCVRVASFIRPGRACFMFLWRPLFLPLSLFFLPPELSYLLGFSGGAGQAPSGDRALIVRTLKKTHNTYRPVSRNMRKQIHVHTHTQSEDIIQYSALAISISLN